jgi:Protein of unknown function (DUF2510)
VFHLSGSQWVIYGALSVLWAFIGYRLSENDRKLLGRTPWGLPSWVWAFFWLMSLLVGLVLYLIAHNIGVRQAQRNPPVMGPAGSGPPPPMAIGRPSSRPPTASDLFPAYPRPANSQPAPVDEAPDEPSEPPAPEGQAPPAGQGSEAGHPTSPPAWHPDPSGRFHYRWWDGSQWTSQVSTDGHHLIDTNPDQRIGPY